MTRSAGGKRTKKELEGTRVMNLGPVGNLILEKWKNLLTETGSRQVLEGQNSGQLREGKQFRS